MPGLMRIMAPARTASPVAQDAELSLRPSLWGADTGWDGSLSQQIYLEVPLSPV